MSTPWPMRLRLFCDVLHAIGSEAASTDWRWPS
jgi:hypothetical protein